MKMGQRVALLGGGKMGEALLAGMLRAGRTAADVVVTERLVERAAVLRDR
jgi:pyrroline-5-carboxylate reductase